MLLVDKPALHSFGHCPVVTFWVSGPGAEEFLEIEGRIFYVLETCKGFAEIEGKDVQTWQTSVWIGVSKVVEIPFGLGSLLHHIVPSVDFVFLVVVQ